MHPLSERAFGAVQVSDEESQLCIKSIPVSVNRRLFAEFILTGEAVSKGPE